MKEIPWEVEEKNFGDIIVSPARVRSEVTKSESDIAVLARLIGGLPARNWEEIEKQAVDIGKKLGEKAYYSYPMGGKTINGASIYAADALRHLCGGIAVLIPHYEIDENNNRIELTVRVIDLRNGIVEERPHVYGLRPAPERFTTKPEEKSRWVAMQIQGAISRATRTTILHIFPAWIVESLINSAMQVVTKQTKSAAIDVEKETHRRLETVKWFAAKGIPSDILFAKYGKPETWSSEIANEIYSIGRSINSKEVSVEQCLAEWENQKEPEIKTKIEEKEQVLPSVTENKSIEDKEDEGA